MPDAGVPGAAPAQGPPITVENGWANPSGDKSRTTVGIGELSGFTVSDLPGGNWRSADGTGTTVNSVTFQWTASKVGTNKITYTAADKSISTVTMTTVAPASLSGKKDRDITTFAAGLRSRHGAHDHCFAHDRVVPGPGVDGRHVQRQRDQRLLH